MEATTPPNTTGFNRKPTRKNRKSLRSRNAGYRKASRATQEIMPTEATAWLYVSMFLMAAAQLLAPLMNVPESSSITAD